MKRQFKYFAMVVWVGIFLSACNTQLAETIPATETVPSSIQSSNTPYPTATNTLTLTNTPEPTKTLTPTPTSTPEPTQTFTPTPTPRLDRTPYPTKQVLFNYSRSGWVGAFDRYLDWHWSRLVLYSDGQLIITGQPYQQKILSAEAIDQFMTELEKLGFFAIETNQAHDPSDPLYEFGDQYSKITGGTYYCVTVTGERESDICVFGVYRDFLIAEMENVLTFLDEYQPEGMSIYYPYRILLDVLTGRNPYDDSPDEAIHWPDQLLPLDTPGEKVTFVDETLEEKMLFVEGEAAKEIYAFLADKDFNSVFTQDDIEYTISYKIVLPHKNISFP